MGLASYVPWVEEKRKWNARSAIVTFPLIAGFVFIQSGQNTNEVSRLAGFLRWIMFNRQPGIVTQEEIETMKLACRPEARAKQEPNFVEGSIVMVSSGPFQGKTGIVVNRNAGFVRLKISGSLSELGGFSVQIPIKDLR